MQYDDFGDGPANGAQDAAWRSVGANSRGRSERPRRSTTERARHAKKEDKGAPSLAHVPCKFYMQGRCTAGDSCPFSHEHPENTAVCKYFLAGTCKYGTSCALAHVSPVGTLVKTKAVRNIRNANIRERAEMRDRDPMMGNSVDDFGDVLLSSADPIVVGSPIRRGSHLAVSPPTDSILAQAAANGLRPSLARSDPMDFREPRRRVDSLIEDDDDDNHGSPVNLLPSSLSDLLTPMEQMQLSRSQEDTYLRSRGNGLGLENAGPISLLPSSSRRLPGVSSARLSQSYAPGRIVDDPLKLYGRSIPEDIVSSPSTRLPYSTSDRSRSESLFSMGAENLLSGPSSRSLLSGAFDGTGFLSAANAGSAQSPAPSLARGLSPSEGNGGSTWNPMADEIDVFHMDSIDEDAVAGEDLEMKIQQSLPPISGSASGAPSPRTVSNQTVLSFSAAAKKAIVTDPIAPERPSPAMQEAAKITKSVAPDPRRNTPLCPFAVTGSCKIGAERCRYVHGLVCPSCNRAVLHPADSAAEHQAHVFECQKAMAASEDSKAQMDQGKDMECGICFEKVMSKKDPRFGLLLCPHAFCIECIRGWRSAHQQDESKSCPLCRVFTPFITPSAVWLGDAEKMEAVERYKEALGKIPCKWWNYGQGTCPFGTSCFYRHQTRDGKEVKMELRAAKTAEGTGVVLSAVKLSDFLFPQ